VVASSHETRSRPRESRRGKGLGFAGYVTPALSVDKRNSITEISR
jgi:hypothetical protein